MFLKIKVFVLFVCASTCFLACRIDSLNDPIIISLVDKEFSIDLWENLQSPSNPLEFHFQTIAEENCLNTSIISSYGKGANDELSFTIFNILAPESCDPGMAPATGFESIHSLFEEGVYPLNVELQDVVSNMGILQVTNDFYQIEMDEEVGINWVHKKLLRVPQFALWGYITFQSGEQLTTANEFITSLDDFTSVFENEDGYYGHFVIENSEITGVKKAPIDATSKIFIKTYLGAVDDMDVVINDFRNSAPIGMELHVFDGKGNEW